MGAAIWHALQARGLDVGSDKRESHITFLSIDIFVLCMFLAISIGGVIKFLMSLKKGGWSFPSYITISISQAPYRRTRRIVKVYMVLVLLAPSVVFLLDQDLLWITAESFVGLLSSGVSLWACLLVQEARIEVRRRMYGARDPEGKRPTSPEGKE
jgi:hypothetical protein